MIGTFGECKVGAQTCNFYVLIIISSKVTLFRKSALSSLSLTQAKSWTYLLWLTEFGSENLVDQTAQARWPDELEKTRASCFSREISKVALSYLLLLKVSKCKNSAQNVSQGTNLAHQNPNFVL